MYYPKWTSDGKKIAYVIRIGEAGGTWVMNLDGSEKRKIILGDYPDWRSDSKRVVYVGPGAEIWVADTNGTNAKPLTSLNSITQYPKWSPDGSKIIFGSMKASPPQIYVMDADGNNIKQLTTEGANYPAWSPDGKYIVYTDARREYGRLFIMKADGSDKRQLTFEE
jgi:TolB protein